MKKCVHYIDWKGRYYPKDRWEDNIRMDLKEIRCKTKFVWLRLGTSGRIV